MTVTKFRLPAIVKCMALCCAGIMLLASAASAQTKTVVFSGTKIAVKQALEQIKTQTGYGIAYNSSTLDAEKIVTLSGTQLEVDAAMKQILAGSGFDYSLSHDVIAITKSTAPQNAVAQTTTSVTKPSNMTANGAKPTDKPVATASASAPVVTVAVPVEIAVAAPAVVANAPVGDVVINPTSQRGTQLNDYNAEKRPVFAIKSNLLYDATTTINLGVEVGLGKRTSLDVPVSVNPWTFNDNRKWQHFLIQPEFRLWTCERFNGGFWGIHAHYANYNVSALNNPPFSKYMSEHRFEGWLVGAGISYGYHWILTPRWGLEATIGAGYAYLEYDKFPCAKCGQKISSETKHYFGPTKVGLNLVFMIK